MASKIMYGKNLAGVVVNAVAVGSTQASFDAQGFAEVDSADTNLVSGVNKQGASVVDVEGTEEALTPGTVQTATTLSALVFRNGAGITVLNVRDENGTGALVFGPLSIAASAERAIVFPTQIPASAFATGVFIDVDSGALDVTTPGFLIP
jgi:hypothetical protein